MRIKKFNLSFLIGTTVLITSCVSNKGFEKNFIVESKLGRETNDVFVIKKTGDKISGQKLTYSSHSIWKVKQKENWIAVDGQKIEDDEYEIFQTSDAYMHLYKPENSIYKRPFYINRLRFGKINLYYYEDEAVDKDVRGDVHLYVFEKEKGRLQALIFDSFSVAISDNQQALQKFRQLYPKAKIPRFNEKGNLKNLIEVVELYNQ